MPFLKNRWYAGAFFEDLSQQPIGRILVGEALVLYRTEGGEAVALGDRCPHRFAPLHKGKVFGDSIQCPYHGLQYGPNGACTVNPLGKGTIPSAAKVPSYPIRERDGIVWIWFGDQAPDEDKIVRFEMFGQPDTWTTIHDRIEMDAAYTLVSDNLLDLSHAEFLHPDLATPGFNQRVNLKVSHEGETVTADNSRSNEPITNGFRAMMGPDAPDVVDHRSIVRWHAPSTLYIDIGAKPVGADDSQRVTSITAHMITPATEHTCHYFWKSARNGRVNDLTFSKQMHAIIMKAFGTEDKPMIEMQQRYMEGKTLEELRPVLLPSDSAAGRARQILNGLLERQAARSVSDQAG